MTALQEISDAIRGRHLIEFTYKLKRRRVEPHILGYDADGELLLSAWQLGLPGGWRNFHVSNLTGLSTAAETFVGVRLGYNRFDPAFHRILAQV